ncbi:VOC family protein [Nocardia sp. BMG51109]|uniref:2-oxoadipate dioxygenase/decarboxylase n=1 Tax=Nocardia sp. BMG51109 TaxID=1056816 RepID=UPI000467D82B|nr:VOC family protein [Nocardia sp. BMG51109]
MSLVPSWELRAEFARALSAMYGTEVPAYNDLLEVATEVNGDVLGRDGADAERLGDAGRVAAERHGAIRVGTPREMRRVATIFAGFGMTPVGFYDLREAATSAVPVVSTAFRPVAPEELALNPFRVFTSLLVIDDPRFFAPEITAELSRFLDDRELFGEELLELAVLAQDGGGLPRAQADRYVRLATAAFELSGDPVDHEWYRTLDEISSVAADIGGVTSTHINHLTPRVLDIDELYRRMEARGITMIDEIQGPPRWAGPDVLLRQTSFRALAEPRKFRAADGSVFTGSLRLRFGEVEARGVALTPAGRDLYDRMIAKVDARLADRPGRTRQEVAAEVWSADLPASEDELALRDLAYFTFTVAAEPPSTGRPGTDLAQLVRDGWVTPQPIVYEDFLPRSAAGIFQSNLTSEGHKDTSRDGSDRSPEWLSEILGRPVADPYDLYAAQRQASLDRVARQLGLSAPITLTKDSR